MCYQFYDSPLGKLVLVSDGRGLRLCAEAWRHPEFTGAGAHGDAVTIQAERQLREYFAGERRAFTVELVFGEVSEFRARVYRRMVEIPYGERATYGEIAARIGTRGIQAVGSACGANELLIFVPCHRVVPASGGIGQFRLGEKTKRFLLELEKPDICKITNS